MEAPAKPPHNGKLGLGGSALVKVRLPKEDLEAMKLVEEEIEPVMVESGYLDGAPFSWVTLILRYGLQSEPIPHYQRINKVYGDLPLAIEIEASKMIGASLEELTEQFRAATLRALVHAGKKYDRPVDKLRAMMSN